MRATDPQRGRRITLLRAIKTRLRTFQTASKAVRFIREHACDKITVDDVLAHARTSRSTLERSIRQHLGHSPQAEIRLVRLKRVKQLLEETNLSLPRIAEIAGFAHPVKKLVGQTPS